MKSLTLVYQANDVEIESMLDTLAEALKRTGLGSEGKVLVASCHGDAMEERDEAKVKLAEARNALQMIVHATEPSHDDGAYHENAHSLAVAGLSASV